MSDHVEHVWPLDGIHDLPAGWQALTVPAMREIEVRWHERMERLAGSEELGKFTERLHREWAIETGQIENLYDIERGVTQTLIEQGFDAALMPHGSVNKDPEYIVALLRDQQQALEGLFSFVRQDRPLSTSYIKELHAAMCRSQASVRTMDQHGVWHETELLRGEYKKQPNFPRRNGTVFQYCPPEQTAPEMERLVEMHLQHQDKGVAAEVEAAWLHHRFTQIHPFQDGNGRVARALASLVLIRAGLFPMVVNRDERYLYIESLERADTDELASLVLLIAREQENRFGRAMMIAASVAPPGDTVQEAARQYGEAIEHTRVAKMARQEERVQDLNNIIMPHLESKAREATRVLVHVDPKAAVGVSTRANFDADPQLVEKLGLAVRRPSMFADVTIRSSYGNRHAVLVIAAVTNGMDSDVATFVFARVGECYEVVVPARVWTGHMHRELVTNWTANALTQTLHFFREKFA